MKTTLEIGKIANGVFYRNDVPCYNPEWSAFDVVKYESDLLGNTKILTQALSVFNETQLKSIPCHDIIWLTVYKKDAKRHGKEIRSYEIKNGIVLADDDEGGFLIHQKELLIYQRETKDAQTIHNIKEFITALGVGETLGEIGHNLYRYGLGLWMVFPVEGREKPIYYRDKEANDIESLNLPITGIMVGSIVEGSEVEVGGYTLDFPFEMSQYDQLIANIDDEVAFYFRRDNTNNYKIIHPETEEILAFADCLEGEWTWYHRNEAVIVDEDVQLIQDFMDEQETLDENEFSLISGLKVKIVLYYEEMTF